MRVISLHSHRRSHHRSLHQAWNRSTGLRGRHPQGRHPAHRPGRHLFASEAGAEHIHRVGSRVAAFAPGRALGCTWDMAARHSPVGRTVLLLEDTLPLGMHTPALLLLLPCSPFPASCMVLPLVGPSAAAALALPTLSTGLTSLLPSLISSIPAQPQSPCQLQEF